MATHKHPPEFRPYRITMYAIAGAAVSWFIGCIIWSVQVGSARASTPGAPASATACADQLEILSRELSGRAAANDGRDWNAFSAAYEQKLATFQAHCVEASPSDATPAFSTAVREAAEALDALRAHISRCGEEADRSRADVAKAIEKVRAAGRR